MADLEFWDRSPNRMIIAEAGEGGAKGWRCHLVAVAVTAGSLN